MKRFILKYTPLIGKLFLFTGVILFFFTISFWRIWSTIGMFFILFGFILNEKKPFKDLKTEEYFLLASTTSLFALYLISFLLNFNSEDNYWFEIQKRVCMIFIPFSVILQKPFDLKIQKLGLLLFIIGINITNLIIYYKTLIYYTEYNTIPFGNGDELNKVLYIHRPYLGFLNVISIVILLFRSPFNKTSFWVITFINSISIIVLINARASAGSIGLLLLLFIFTGTKSISKKVIGILTLITTLFLVIKHPQFDQRFSKLLNNEPRTLIWPCVNEALYNDNYSLMFGYGSGIEAQKELSLCYKAAYLEKTKWQWVWRDGYNYNTHNQFLDLLLSFGILGSFFYCLFYTGFITKYIKKRDPFILALATVIFLNFLLENYFSRQIGIYTVVMITSIGTKSFSEVGNEKYKTLEKRKENWTEQFRKFLES